MFTQDKHKDLKNVVQEQIDMMANRVNTLQFQELEKKVEQQKALADDENDLL
jgi:TolA-binding protein|tara:strand:+ start:1230 stop:1385 length:156 start_codon:yes stop_codon:yes gene_type:complete